MTNVMENSSPLPGFEGNTTKTFDQETLWNHVNGDLSLLRELIAILEHHFPAHLAQIQASLESAQGPDLERAAHKLKGSLLQFSATKATRSAAALEDMAKANALEGAAELVSRLRSEVRLLLDDLKAMLRAHDGQSANV